MTRDRARSAKPYLIAVNRFYWPDHSATSQLLTDLCQRAASEGFRVTVVTSRMLYDDPKARLRAREFEGGVRICRVWTTRLGRSWSPARALDYISFGIAAFLAVLWLARGDAVLLVKTDPPLLSVPLGLAARLRRSKVVNWLQDLFPEVASELGVRWAGGGAGRVIRTLRNRSLRSAAVNVAISPGMARRLSAEGVQDGIIRVHPNWAERNVVPVPREANGLRRAWFPDDRFVICYSGNLGRAHAVAAVCDLVRVTAGLPKLSWLFIGGGSGIDAVRATAAETKADVRFQPYQPRSLLSSSLSAGDLHLVSLDPGCEGLIMPSKLYGIMAAGRGVLALGSREGEVAREVTQGGFGVGLDITRPDTWRDQVLAAMSNEVAEEFGRRARCRFDAVYQPDRIQAEWLQTLRSVALADAGAIELGGVSAPLVE